jgi:hypothetical protein
VDYDASTLILEGDLLFSSQAEHLEWEIEIGYRCGQCLQAYDLCWCHDQSLYELGPDEYR